jgi:general secretion pathway protein D
VEVVGLQWVGYQYLRRQISRAWLVGILLGPSLLGCTSTDKSIPMPDAVDPVRNADFKARFPLADDRRYDTTAGASHYLIVPGTDSDRPPPTSAPARDASGRERTASADVTGTAPGGRIEINLDNADIPTAAKTLLGDILQLNYVIDPRVQGTVSLASVGPIDRKEVLPIFENVLRMSNAVIVRDADLVKIVPAPEAAGSGSFSAGVGPAGFGVSVIPLRYASAAAIAKTTENFLSRPGALRADPMHNLVLIQGTTAERQELIEVISAFDVEWLHNQSVGLYPLKSTQPETMIQELDRIFETNEGGQGQGVVHFQPISRMNAVMVVAKSPKLLERVTHWIDRLDRSDNSGTALRVYRLKNAEAKQVAKIMNDLFVNRSGNAETPFSQLTPGAQGSQSRLDALGTSGSGGTGGSGLGTQSSASATGGTAQSSSGLGASNKSTSTSFQSFFDHQNAEDKDSSSLSAGTLPRGLFQNVRITADTGNNSIIVYSNLEDFHVIEHALHDIDQPKLQVSIEATVAEVTLTDDLQYGVQNFLTSNDLHLGNDKGSVGLFPAATATNPTTTVVTNGSSTTTTTATVAATQFLSRVLPGFNLLLGPEAQPRLILSALSTLTEVKVLSSPSLVALDDQPAMIEVGQDIPITTSSATLLANSGTPIVNTIDMRSTGVILKILPHIHSNGTVQLEIEQEISNVVNPNQQTLTPTISERRVRSTIVVTNGQTVMLGGLISDQTDNSKAGLPGVNQIQYLGDILGTTSKTKQRQEIIIFIKPQVVRNTVDMQSITEEFRQRLQSMHTSDSVTEGNAGAAALNPRKN